MSEFDWVTTRAKCSLAKVFDNLQLAIHEDVEKRQELRPKDDITGTGYSHAFHVSHSRNQFMVSLVGHLIEKRSVIFTLDTNAIAVHDANEQLLLRFSVTLNNEGRCVAKLASGQEMEFWQVRQKTLESLFFETGPAFNVPQ